MLPAWNVRRKATNFPRTVKPSSLPQPGVLRCGALRRINCLDLFPHKLLLGFERILHQQNAEGCTCTETFGVQLIVVSCKKFFEFSQTGEVFGGQLMLPVTHFFVDLIVDFLAGMAGQPERFKHTGFSIVQFA